LKAEQTRRSTSVSRPSLAGGDGKIVEEYLKYDNAAFLQQVGLA